ncbi:MAG: Gfo/Idh/MocA family oxidoreductase [Candidatus Hydrogenedentes bacterium]|nr:Gfo/Idh/MocA family oxidoreductase [Candidatus Hydrogenedentota bacterium]
MDGRLRPSGLASRSGAKIVALCDVDFGYAGPAVKDFSDAPRYKDYRRLLEKEKGIDAVIVGTPDHTHAMISMAAIRAGKHVYCEKPLAHTLYEVRKLTEAAREHNVATQLGNQGKTYESLQELAECIWAGTIGEVREVHIQQAGYNYSRIDALSSQMDDHPVPDSLDWDLWLGPASFRKYNPMYHPGAWRGWSNFGTGMFGDWVCHLIDPVFTALDLGAPISVVAEAEGYDHKIHGETFPLSSKIRFEFPARGQRPPVTLYWYDGDRYAPPHPKNWKKGKNLSHGRAGTASRLAALSSATGARSSTVRMGPRTGALSPRPR